MLRTMFTAAFVATVLSGITAVRASDGGGDSCGWFAFAGSFQNARLARRQANRLSAWTWDVDASNSANAGEGWWAVGVGPTSRAQAKRERRRLQRRGVNSYVAKRCFYDQ